MKPSQTLTPEEIRKHFPHATASTLRANGDKTPRTAPGAPTRAARRTIKAILTAEATPTRQTREIERKAGFTGNLLSQFVPVPIRSEANTREHWRTKAKHVKEQREKVAYFLDYIVGRPKPSRISLRRQSARSLDDDNLANGFKHVRDEIAKLLNFDDRDPSVQWAYSQAKNTVLNGDGFTIVIEWDAAPTCPHCGQSLPVSK